MFSLSKHASINRAASNNVILSHHDEENYGITLRCLKQVLKPTLQIPQCRALKHNVLLIS